MIATIVPLTLLIAVVFGSENPVGQSRQHSRRQVEDATLSAKVYSRPKNGRKLPEDLFPISSNVGMLSAQVADYNKKEKGDPIRILQKHTEIYKEVPIAASKEKNEKLLRKFEEILSHKMKDPTKTRLLYNDELNLFKALVRGKVDMKEQFLLELQTDLLRRTDTMVDLAHRKDNFDCMNEYLYIKSLIQTADVAHANEMDTVQKWTLQNCENVYNSREDGVQKPPFLDYK